MNQFSKFVILFFALFFASFQYAQAQEESEIKLVNGTNEAMKVAIAVIPAPGEAPMIVKVVSFATFGEYQNFNLAKTEQLLVAALDANVNVSELSPIPADLMESFNHITIEGAGSCDIILKGSFEEGIMVTISNLKW